MATLCEIISNMRFNVDNDSFFGLGSNNRSCFSAKEHCSMRTSMQRVGVDLCKCHARFHKARIGLVFHPTPPACLFPTTL